MITAKDVFLPTMYLIDEESQDGTFTGYPEEYKKKSWSLLTMLQTELLDSTVTPSVITDENSIFLLDDKTCLMTLPYGLAAHLLMEEDPNRAAFFNARYDELKRIRPIFQTTIENVYCTEPTGDSIVFSSGGGDV